MFIIRFVSRSPIWRLVTLFSFPDSTSIPKRNVTKKCQLLRTDFLRYFLLTSIWWSWILMAIRNGSRVTVFQGHLILIKNQSLLHLPAVQPPQHRTPPQTWAQSSCVPSFCCTRNAVYKIYSTPRHCPRYPRYSLGLLIVLLTKFHSHISLNQLDPLSRKRRRRSEVISTGVWCQLNLVKVSCIPPRSSIRHQCPSTKRNLSWTNVCYERSCRTGIACYSVMWYPHRRTSFSRL